MSEPIPIFASFQYNAGWHSWEQVIPSAIIKATIAVTRIVRATVNSCALSTQGRAAAAEFAGRK